MFTLCAFAIAQPLYALLGPNGEFFVAHGAGRTIVVALVVVLSVGVPLLLVGLERVAGLIGGARASAIAHRGLVSALSALAVLPILRHVRFVPGLVTMGAAAVFGIACAVFAGRAPIRRFLVFLSPAIVLFPVAFVGFTPVRHLVAAATYSDEGAGRAIDNPAPIVLIVFDELTTMTLLDARGAIDSGRFPNFAALAGNSTWFPNTMSAAPSTDGALPRILTGRDFDDVGRLPIVADYPQNLFTYLGGSYALDVHESLTQLCPAYLCTSASRNPASEARAIGADLAALYVHAVLPADIAGRLLPPLGTRWRDFRWRPSTAAGRSDEDEASGWNLGSRLSSRSREGRRAYFLRAIEDIRAGDRPALHFIHVPLPHYPFEYLPSGGRYLDVAGSDGRLGDTRWTTEEPLVATAYRRYVAQVEMTDMLLGRLIERLRHEGLYDRALLIVTSDHGAAFVPGQSHREPNNANYEPIYAVPLIVKRPYERTAHVDDRLVSNLDILATVGDVLQVRPAWPSDGMSLFAANRAGARLPGRFTFPPFDVRAIAPRVAARLPSLKAQEPWFGAANVPADLPPAPGLRAVSHGFFQFARVDPQSGVVPALVTGTIVRDREGPAAPYEIAIAVNGRIASTTRTVRWYDAPAYFTVLLSSDVFERGANRLEVLWIDRTVNPPRLRPIPSALPEALQIAGDGSVPERLDTAAGDHIPITPDRVVGWVSPVEDVSRTSLRLHGWAVDAGSGQPVRSILVFAGANLVDAQVPSVSRPDVAAQFPQASTTLMGFMLDLDKSVLAQGCVRVLALTADNRAGPLLVADEARQMLNACP